MKPSPESSSSNESTESISTEWDILTEPDNVEQNNGSPELGEDNINKEQNAEFAPEGWFTKYGLVEKLKSSIGVIQKVIDGDEELGLPPLEERAYKTIKGRLFPHYSMVDVEKRLKQLTAPEGWYTIGGLADELGLSVGTIKRAIAGDEEFGLLPLEAREYKTTAGLKLPHYSLAEAKKRIEQLTAPEGWYIQKELAEELGISATTIREYIKQDPPLKARKYIGADGNRRPYYSLTEIEERRAEIIKHRERSTAPEGWYPIGAKKNRRSSKGIKR